VRRGGRGVVQRALRSRGRELRRYPGPLLATPTSRLTIEFEHLIALRMLAGAELFFLQIGAFDGRSGDQLHEWITRYRWPGILVEPHPTYFRALQETYRDRPDLTLRNVAISEAPGTNTLYCVRDGVAEAPHWAPQAASFDREHTLASIRRWHSGPGDELIEEIPVHCVPLPEVLTGVAHLDLLQVDVEGYDAEIIRMFDFDAHTPSIVRFESIHLSQHDHDAAVRRLLEHGYRVAAGHRDTIAWHGD
jgi:FkbM family methyltransferase